MAERELFVVCSQCGNEVSPYVTECPYCGNRLRKRAPDLKKQRKLEEKEAKRAEKKRAKLKAVYEGGSSGGAGAWLDRPGGRPIATIVLVAAAVVVSLIARVEESVVLDGIYFGGDAAREPWRMLTAPFIHGSFGYGFVCLLAVALFGAGIEKRYGAAAVVLTWVLCGAFGVLGEDMIATVAISNGSIGVAVGMFAAWLVIVLQREDLRDYDAIGLGAMAAVLLAMPIASDEASVWTLFGGLIGGLVCGWVLSRFEPRSFF